MQIQNVKKKETRASEFDRFSLRRTERGKTKQKHRNAINVERKYLEGTINPPQFLK